MYPPLTRVKLDDVAIISVSDLKSIEKALEPFDKRKNELEDKRQRMLAAIEAKNAGSDISETVDSIQEELNKAREVCGLFEKAKDKHKIENGEDSEDVIKICKMSLQLS